MLAMPFFLDNAGKLGYIFFIPAEWMVRMMINTPSQKRFFRFPPGRLDVAFRRPLLLLPVLFTILLPAGILFSAFPFQEAFSQAEEIDPFYHKLSKEGKYFFQNGQYGEAVKSMEIAFFGFIDNPKKLLECYCAPDRRSL
jgi:hypothetical protein